MTAPAAPSTQDVLVGIVTLNRKDKLVKTLQECRRVGFENILVLDNGSTDGTREYLREQPGIATIFSDRNDGASAGFNSVMRHFLERATHRWLLTFDDDAYPVFHYRDLQKYLERHRHSGHPAYAFKVTYPDGSLCEMNKPGINVLASSPLRHLTRNFHIDESTQGTCVDFASFVGLLLARETLQAVGIVSKEFFIYSDDTYYTLSISSRIGKIFYCPDFVLVHDCKRSSRSFVHHSPMRLEKDIVNKIVMIREYSKFASAYVALYVARSIFLNPRLIVKILQASRKGLAADITLYRNEAVPRGVLRVATQK